ncbi:hypothetical protein [Thermoflavimicrobium dichotomicum]|nr:hypothetical protein [Thermoflavimicrobium dichotomicum]
MKTLRQGEMTKLEESVSFVVAREIEVVTEKEADSGARTDTFVNKFA